MRLLLDTNIVLRAVNRNDPDYPLVSRAVQMLSLRGDELVVVPQVIYEFWSVATRPARVNGLGWSLQLVRAETDDFDDFMEQWSFLEDTPEVFRRWLGLVTTHQVSGKQVHDARLAAALDAHGVEHLLTLNGDDFSRVDLGVVRPLELE